MTRASKYIFIILSFYAFWILGIPFIFSKTLPQVCENISQNSDYIIEVNKPQLFLSPIPTAKIKAENISIQSKKTEDLTQISNFETSIRLLPLLSGRIHINKIMASDISVNSVLNKEFELDKDVLSDFRKTKLKCDEISLKKLFVNIHEPKLSSPAVYTARDVYYTR